MLKHHGQFMESIEDVKAQVKKGFDVPPLLTATKSQVTRNFKHHAKSPIVIKDYQSVRSTSCVKLSPSKNKRKKNKSSVFIKLATISRPDILHNYLSYTEIQQYLDYIKLRFIDFVKVHTLGTTFEQRPIKCIEINWNKENRPRSAPLHYVQFKKLDDDGSEKSGRNIVFIEGGTHAREWISVTVALNCIYQLTEKNVRHRDLLCKLRFYIVPVVNPDGYEYARNVNPRWRKNRRPHINCDYVGTDCNRNFDFHWDSSSSKAKRNTYQGDKPFSEHETKALAKILLNLAPKLLFFLSLHSYAQSIMYPWGYSNLLPKNAKLMKSVAIAGRNAIKALSGRYFRVGSIFHITKRNIAGSVVDYAYGAVKIPLTLVMELPSSEYGFQPPAEKIHPLGMESWHGIREMCKKAYSLKAQIEEEEMKETNQAFRYETKNKKSILAKDFASYAETNGTNVLKETSCENEKEEIKKQYDTNHDLISKNSTLKTMHMKMCEGIITTMQDVTF